MPYFAALICNMQVLQVIIVELINIYNLNLLNNIMDLIYDFVAFACICDFDDSMLISLMSSKMRVFIGHDIIFCQFRKPKVHCKLIPQDDGGKEAPSLTSDQEKNSFDGLNELNDLAKEVAINIDQTHKDSVQPEIEINND